MPTPYAISNEEVKARVHLKKRNVKIREEMYFRGSTMMAGGKKLGNVNQCYKEKRFVIVG